MSVGTKEKIKGHNFKKKNLPKMFFETRHENFMVFDNFLLKLKNCGFTGILWIVI